MKLREMELNNIVNSTLLNVKVYFKMKKLIVDENKQNICELAHLALEKNGIKSVIKTDENGCYSISIEKINKVWNGDENA